MNLLSALNEFKALVEGLPGVTGVQVAVSISTEFDLLAPFSIPPRAGRTDTVVKVVTRTAQRDRNLRRRIYKHERRLAEACPDLKFDCHTLDEEPKA
jgi:hypothetical protein